VSFDGFIDCTAIDRQALDALRRMEALFEGRKTVMKLLGRVDGWVSSREHIEATCLDDKQTIILRKWHCAVLQVLLRKKVSASA
jgi:hypothetical protein